MSWINTERPHQSLDYDVPVNVFLRDIKNMDAFLNMGVQEVVHRQKCSIILVWYAVCTMTN